VSRTSARAKLVLLAQTYTTREIARMIGAGERSVRRWKNEGKEPRKPVVAKRLQKVYAREAETVRRELRRDKIAHPSAHPKAEHLPPVRGVRRMLKERVINRKTGEAVATGREVVSSWINYDVRGWNVREIHALLVSLWEAGGNRDVQFIYEIPKGGRYPDRSGKPGRAVSKRTRTGSSPILLSRTGTTPVPFSLIESEAELLDLILHFVDAEQGPKSRRMVYVAINDAGAKAPPPKKRKAKRRAKRKGKQ
jgi:hypothetical protein